MCGPVGALCSQNPCSEMSLAPLQRPGCLHSRFRGEQGGVARGKGACCSCARADQPPPPSPRPPRCPPPAGSTFCLGLSIFAVLFLSVLASLIHNGYPYAGGCMAG